MGISPLPWASANAVDSPSGKRACPCASLCSGPPVLSVHAAERSLAPSSPQPPAVQLRRAARSTLCLIQADLANPISYIFPKSSSRCQGHVPKDMVERFGNGVAGCCSLERPCGCQQTASAASCLTWVAPPRWVSPSPSCWPFPEAFLHCPECTAEPHLRPRCCNWKTGER